MTPHRAKSARPLPLGHSDSLSPDAKALYEGFKHFARTGGLPTFGYAMSYSKLDFVAGLRALQELKEAGMVEDLR